MRKTRIFAVLAAMAMGLAVFGCSNGDSSSESAVFQSSKFSKGILQIEYKADGTFLMTLSEGDYYSAASARDFGKGTYTLDGTFENGTIHLHQTHESDTSGWVEYVEDKTLTVKDGKFTAMGLTFTKVGSSSSSGSGTGSEGGSTGGTTSGGGSEGGSTGGTTSGGGSESGSTGGSSSESAVRDFGKGTYTLDGTFENGTIHLHQTHTPDSSGWVEHVEDMTLAVKDGKFTVNMGEIITFTKVGSSSSSGSGTGSESGSTGGSSSESAVFQSSRFSKGILKIEYKADGTFLMTLSSSSSGSGTGSEGGSTGGTTSGGDSESGSTGGSSSSGGSSSESVVFQSSGFSRGTLQIEYKADGTFLMTLSSGDNSAASTRDFGKGTYTLDGTFENGTIHLHQTHTPDSSGWVEQVEDMTLAVKDGKFTVNMGEIITFTKVSFGL